MVYAKFNAVNMPVTLTSEDATNMWSLSTLASGNATCSSRARKAGVIEAVMKAMHRHADNEALQEEACAVWLCIV